MAQSNNPQSFLPSLGMEEASPAGPLFTHHCPPPPIPTSPPPSSGGGRRRRRWATSPTSSSPRPRPQSNPQGQDSGPSRRPPTPPPPAPPPHRSRPCPSPRQPRARSPLLQLLERRVALLLEKPHGTTPGKTLWLRILGPFLLQLLVMELKRNGPLQAHPSYQKTL
ncbi:hypothetical protein PVAP13_8NG355402 [Panicum virgatum]|uniref:Uncharacterized protein n=1 Tax=Panicum virgatum TaxID=38727 RepID=A0A8T0P0S6_PANVG|nr:hypothetical protein PVAP13_8NG355402 [Panicum virgatum]